MTVADCSPLQTSRRGVKTFGLGHLRSVNTQDCPLQFTVLLPVPFSPEAWLALWPDCFARRCNQASVVKLPETGAWLRPIAPFVKEQGQDCSGLRHSWV